MKALKRSHTSPSSPSNHSSSSSPASSASAASISTSPPSNSSSALSNSSWIHFRSVLFVVASTSPASPSSSSTDRSRVKSPWSRGKRKHALSPQQWTNMFAPNGKLHDAGVKLLKIVRSGGVDTSIRAEVWQFLLGVYDFESSKEERDIVRNQKALMARARVNNQVNSWMGKLFQGKSVMQIHLS